MANWMHISSFWSEMHLIHSALISKISLKDIAWIWLLHFYVSYPKNFDIQETSQQNTCVHLGIIVVVRKGLSDSSPHSNISFPIILPWVDVWPLKIHCSAGHQWGNPMWYWYHPTFVLSVRVFRCFQWAIERGANNVTGIVRPTNHGKLLLLHSRIHYHEKPKTRG